MRSPLSFKAKRAWFLQIAPRDREASPARKTVLLDEFVAATGSARTSAIRLLSHPVVPRLTIERPRPPPSGPEVQQALHLAWTAANPICAKRLLPFLPTLVKALERHGHLQVSEEDHVPLLSMSPATADRILQPYRQQERHGISPTRSGTLLNKPIPIRTCQEWSETPPGFMEADATGWTECLPLLGRGQEAVIPALKRARQLLPFPLLGSETDKGGEFIHMELAISCEQEHITLTRGRPRKRNDQCYVEQKNGQRVRQVVGSDRFTGEIASRHLTEWDRARRIGVNCFQPSMKRTSKEREGRNVRRTSDQAQTPMQRLLAFGALSAHKQQELRRITEALDPLRLLRQLEQVPKALWRDAVTRKRSSQHLRSHVRSSRIPRKRFR